MLPDRIIGGWLELPRAEGEDHLISCLTGGHKICIRPCTTSFELLFFFSHYKNMMRYVN